MRKRVRSFVRPLAPSALFGNGQKVDTCRGNAPRSEGSGDCLRVRTDVRTLHRTVSTLMQPVTGKLSPHSDECSVGRRHPSVKSEQWLGALEDDENIQDLHGKSKMGKHDTSRLLVRHENRMQFTSEQIFHIRHAKNRRLSKVSATVSVDRRPLTPSIFACIHGGSCVTPIVAFLASVAPMNMHCTAARNLQPHWRNDGARDKEAIWLSSMESVCLDG